MFLTIALGNIISLSLEYVGFTFPASVGAMLASCIYVNLYEQKSKQELPLIEIRCIGNSALTFFLTLSVMTIKPWQLIDLAIPMLIILTYQVLLMTLYAIFITYPFIGRNNSAAIIASSHCGFGLGAEPTAIAIMSSLHEILGNNSETFIIVPLVGSLFINFFNSMIVTFLINIIK